MNSEPNTVHRTNHFDIGTSTATAPAAARSTKPEAIKTRSTTATCLSQALYTIVVTTYVSTTATVCQRPVSAATAQPATINSVPAARAPARLRSPAATGRNRFVGCLRSAATSSTSFQQ